MDNYMHLFGGWQYHILIRSLLQLLYMLPQTLPPLLSTHRIGKLVMAYNSRRKHMVGSPLPQLQTVTAPNNLQGSCRTL